MEIYHNFSTQNNDMMFYQAFQMQQNAFMYGSVPQMGNESDKFSINAKRNKRSYIQCELWKRQSLVEKVEKEGMTIKDAAKVLDINYSTAKHIIKVYRKTGETETKIMIKRNKKDCYSQRDYDENVEVTS